MNDIMCMFAESAGSMAPVDDGWGLDDLLDLDVGELGAADMLAAVRALHQAEAMMHAKRLELMHSYVTDGDSPIDEEFAADVLAAETQASLGRTHSDLALAARLNEDLPGTFAHLKSGRLDRARAWQVADAASVLDSAGCVKLEARIYPGVLGAAPRQLRRRVARAVLAVDPDAADRRATQAKNDRRVSAEPDADGMGWLNVYLPAGDLQAIWQRVDTTARQVGDDARTMDQRRADALRDLILGADNEHVSTTVYVTMTAETLLGLADLPGELHGHGHLPASQVRELAQRLHATWAGLLVDQHGRPEQLADRRYRYTGRLAEFVRLRDRTCVHPACDKPAARCDVDHRVPFPRGSTTATNGDVLCRRHHRMKHHTTWTTTRKPDGSVQWQHPTGTIHTKQPEPAVLASDR